MNAEHDQTAEPDTVLRNVWNNADSASVDADCSPTKVCRNARDFTFDGIAEDGVDLATSWRRLLEQEGKLVDHGSPIRDIMLGSATD